MKGSSRAPAGVGMLPRYVVSQLKQNSYFLLGLGAGLWLALVAVPLERPAACGAPAPLAALDDYEPQREAKAAAADEAESSSKLRVQRPRYYSTELNMRAPLFAAVLTSAEELAGRADAINSTAAQLQPHLKFFITASSLQASPGRANVVGFTDTREILKPFHVLKYLADNYLEEYEMFYLTTDASFINAERVRALAAGVSAGLHAYVGVPAGDGGPYCLLDTGVLVSRPVLARAAAALDWCVRNSYSAHHHENLGRCLLHAAPPLRCTSDLQGQHYSAAAAGAARGAALLAAAAVPAPDAAAHWGLHAALVAAQLQRDRARVAALTRAVSALRRRAPPAPAPAWPPGLRRDAQPPPPPNRFSFAGWRRFNATHVLAPDARRAAAELRGAWRTAVETIVSEGAAWLRARGGGGGGGGEARLVEGAWRADPAAALHYRLLYVVHRDDAKPEWRQLEAARALGGARAAAAPYVTEARAVTAVLAGRAAAAAASWLRAAPRQLRVVVLVPVNGSCADVAAAAAARAAGGRPTRLAAAAGADGGLAAALSAEPGGALALLLRGDFAVSADALNRVRMNTIPGVSWFSAVPLSRDAAGAAAGGAGRGGAFLDEWAALAVHREDYLDAAATAAERAARSPEEVLAASPLRCVRAPEPGLLRPPAPAPAAPAAAPAPPPHLGAAHTLARAVLQHRGR